MADSARAPRLLLIAPDHRDLGNVYQEVMDFVNVRSNDLAYDVRLLHGPVDEAMIARAVAQGQYDVWWIASHGNGQGIQLAHEMIGIEALAPYIRTTGAVLVALNSCESVEIANRIMQECDCDVIATIASIDDKVAARTAGMFALNLLRSGDPRAAYEQAKPGGNSIYVYLSRYGGNPGGSGMGNTWNTAGPPASTTLQSMDRLVMMVEKTQSDVSRLVTEVEVLKTRFTALEGEMHEIKRHSLNGVAPPTWQSYLIVLIAIAVFFVLAVLLATGGAP